MNILLCPPLFSVIPHFATNVSSITNEPTLWLPTVGTVPPRFASLSVRQTRMKFPPPSLNESKRLRVHNARNPCDPHITSRTSLYPPYSTDSARLSSGRRELPSGAAAAQGCKLQQLRLPIPFDTLYARVAPAQWNRMEYVLINAGALHFLAWS